MADLQKTTFAQDFPIAVRFGEKAVRDTYDRAFKEWHTNVRYITALTVILNHLIWYFYDKSGGNQDDPMAKLFNELWRKCDDWCCENLKGDDLAYFYRVTD